MNQINTLLKDSNKLAVNKSICEVATDRIAITPIPYWLCGVDFVDLYTEKKLKELDFHKRLELTTYSSPLFFLASFFQRALYAVKNILRVRYRNSAKVRH